MYNDVVNYFPRIDEWNIDERTGLQLRIDLNSSLSFAYFVSSSPLSGNIFVLRITQTRQNIIIN